jgi:hypothetical protein
LEKEALCLLPKSFTTPNVSGKLFQCLEFLELNNLKGSGLWPIIVQEKDFRFVPCFTFLNEWLHSCGPVLPFIEAQGLYRPMQSPALVTWQNCYEKLINQWYLKEKRLHVSISQT